MSDTLELREQAMKLVKAAQDDLTTGGAELEARADTQLQEARKLEARAASMDEAKAMEARMNAIDTSKRPSESRAIETAVAGRTRSDDERAFYRSRAGSGEMEFRSHAAETRAQTVATNTAGGYTVPVGFYDKLTVSLISYSPLGDPAITNVLETSHGNPMQFPLLNDTASMGYIIGETVTQPTGNAFVFAQQNIGAYTFTNDAVLISYELLEDTGVDLEGVLVNQIGQRIGRKMAQAFTIGTGSGQPTGIVTAISAANATTSTANTGVVTLDDYYNTFHGTETAYRNNPKFAWEMADTTLLAARKLKDAYGRYLLEANYQAGDQPTNILGKRIIINNAMASIATGNIPVIIGDGEGFMVRKTGSVQVQRLVERYADQRCVGFIAWVRADSNLLDLKAMRGMKVS